MSSYPLIGRTTKSYGFFKEMRKGRGEKRSSQFGISLYEFVYSKVVIEQE